MRVLGVCLFSTAIAGIGLIPASVIRSNWNVPGGSNAPGAAGSLSPYSQSSTAPHINSAQLFFMGNPASELIAGTRAKRYSLKIFGENFEQSASVVIDGMRTRTSFASPTELDAGLKGGPLMAPGEVPVRVVNPDGQASNRVIFEVVSDPSTLSIASVNPDFGPPGTQVTITGIGFTPKSNRIRFFSASTGLLGVTSAVESTDGRTLVFSVPGFLCPPCSAAVPPCLAPCFAANPGQYNIFVINENGMSNGVTLLISSPTGPIGFWGEQGLSVEVTDTQVMISGLCFVGQIPQTLTTDAAGSFTLAGTFTPMIGPVGQARPATYEGTISGNLMTLTIRTESSTLGPFTLMFGDKVQIVHPCL